MKANIYSLVKTSQQAIAKETPAAISRVLGGTSMWAPRPQTEAAIADSVPATTAPTRSTSSRRNATADRDPEWNQLYSNYGRRRPQPGRQLPAFLREAQADAVESTEQSAAAAAQGQRPNRGSTPADVAAAVRAQYTKRGA
jgi:hypothetical protein